MYNTQISDDDDDDVVWSPLTVGFCVGLAMGLLVTATGVDVGAATGVLVGFAMGVVVGGAMG